MNKFYNFLESIENHDEKLVGSIKEAYKLIFEGLATEEALDDADMKLEVNTEEKETEDAPLMSDDELLDISEQDIGADSIEAETSPESDEISDEDVRIDGLDELIEEN